MIQVPCGANCAEMIEFGRSIQDEIRPGKAAGFDPDQGPEAWSGF
jgi:hypothetical protein